MKSDFTDDEMQVLLAQLSSASADVLPKMQASKFCVVALLPDAVDAFLAMQLGFALLLEKPIIIFAMRGAWVPARVRRLADVVVEGESAGDPEFRAKAAAAIEQLVRENKIV